LVFFGLKESLEVILSNKAPPLQTRAFESYPQVNIPRSDRKKSGDDIIFLEKFIFLNFMFQVIRYVKITSTRS
jgi:hypothetical protein